MPTVCPSTFWQCAGVKMEVMLGLVGRHEPESMTRSAVKFETKRVQALEEECPEFKTCLYHVIAINLDNYSNLFEPWFSHLGLIIVATVVKMWVSALSMTLGKCWLFPFSCLAPVYGIVLTFRIRQLMSIFSSEPWGGGNQCVLEYWAGNDKGDCTDEVGIDKVDTVRSKDNS